MTDIGTSCLCIELRGAAQQLTRVYDAALEGTGINVTQLSLLSSIHGLDSPTLRALATHTGLDRSTLGRNVRVLERMGLVRIEPGADARTRTLSLTAKGRHALGGAAPRWFAIQRELVEALGGREGFDALLERVAQAADAALSDPASAAAGARTSSG